MIWVDYVFIAVVVLSMLLGVFRGLVREALSLVAWVLAFVLTLHYAPSLAEHLESSIRTPAVRSAAAYAIVFFGVLIIGSVITWAVSTAIKGAGLGSVDRTLGGAFGLARGIFIMAAIVMVVGVSAAKQEHWWKQSFFVPQIEPLANSLQSLIPDRWLAYVRPGPGPAAESESPKLRPEH